MARVCPKCEKRPGDDRLIVCEWCNVPFVDESELKRGPTEEQIESAADRIIRCPAFWIPVGLSVVVLIGTGMGLLDLYFDKKLTTFVAQLKREMTNRIAAEFTTPRIQIVVSNVASER